jgi:hypothetical protein
MDFAPAYLVQRFFYRFVDFFHHWYVDGSRYLGHRFLSILRNADRTIALQITLRHFFEPLYRDYSVIGRILGVIFRTGRIVIGVIVYFFLTLAFLALYLLWLAAPIVPLGYVLLHATNQL